MTDKKFSNKLDKEAKFREKILDDAIKSLQDLSVQKVEEEKTIRQHKVEEIKYKTTIKELNDYIEIYKNKIDELDQTIKKYDKEVISLRKKILKNETDLSTLKSILELFVNEYGIKQIIDITKLDKNKIERYIGEEK